MEITNLVTSLKNQTWWKVEGVSDAYALTTALVSVTEGLPVTSYEEAVTGPESKEWKAAMNVEIDNIRRLGTYTIKKLPY